MNWDSIAEEYLAVAELVFGPLRDDVDKAAGTFTDCLRAGNKIMCCGNGGSAADAQHFAAELVNRFLKDRRPYACIALTTDTSIMTSIGNDYGYDQIFEKQVRALGRKDDVLLAISSSGNAANVCRAVEAARDLGIHTIALTGGSGGRLQALADHVLSISCTKLTPRIQEGHLLVYHAICQRIEELLEGESSR